MEVAHMDAQKDILEKNVIVVSSVKYNIFF